MIDRRPRLIAKCTDVADVIAAVRMAKTTGLRVSILAPIQCVRVDPSSRTVLVGGGAKWAGIRATYRGNYARLVAVKEKYDSENFFRVNQHIRPAA
jgi:hypothetical protein